MIAYHVTFLHSKSAEIVWHGPWKWGEFCAEVSECIWNLGGHNWSSKGPKALANGWLVIWKWVIDYTETWCEEKFCRSQECENEKLAEIWRQVLSFWRFVEKPPAVFEIIFRCFSSGSRSRQHQENHADNTNETVTFFIGVTSISKPQQEHQHEIPRRMVIWCDEVAQKLLKKSGCGNKSTCTCSGNSLRYGLLLDVAFRKLFAIKESLAPQYGTGNMAPPRGTKWWPSMAPLQIGMCQKFRTWVTCSHMSPPSTSRLGPGTPQLWPQWSPCFLKLLPSTSPLVHGTPQECKAWVTCSAMLLPSTSPLVHGTRQQWPTCITCSMELLPSTSPFRHGTHQQWPPCGPCSTMLLPSTSPLGHGTHQLWPTCGSCSTELLPSTSPLGPGTRQQWQTWGSCSTMLLPSTNQLGPGAVHLPWSTTICLEAQVLRRHRHVKEERLLVRTTSCVKLASSVIIQMVHIVRHVLQVRPKLSSVIGELVFLVDVVCSERRRQFSTLSRRRLQYNITWFCWVWSDSVQVLFPPKTVGPVNTAPHGITLPAGLTYAIAVICHCFWWTMTVFLGRLKQ